MTARRPGFAVLASAQSLLEHPNAEVRELARAVIDADKCITVMRDEERKLHKLICDELDQPPSEAPTVQIVIQDAGKRLREQPDAYDRGYSAGISSALGDEASR